MSADSTKAVLKRLAGLPSLDAGTPPHAVIACKICGGQAAAFDVVDFNKCCDGLGYGHGLAGVPVYYYRCPDCQFLFTDFCDAWSAADFRRHIYNDDYIKVDGEYVSTRPQRTAVDMAARLAGCEVLAILDYGSGAGVFVEEMRARGFVDLESYDPFSSPRRPVRKFDLITCFEVIEHSAFPLQTMADMAALLKAQGCMLVGQTLQPPDIERIRGSWWYVAPRNGHVSTFADATFQKLAELSGLSYYRGGSLYGFATPAVPDPVQTVLDRVGVRSNHALSLYAPDPADRDEHAACWHGIEFAAGRAFRWTAKPAVSWGPCEFLRGATEIRIPYMMAIEPDFAARCTLHVGARQLPLEVASGAIIARVVCQKSCLEPVQLLTPPLVTPFQQQQVDDHRPLGLAVLVEPSAAGPARG